MKSINEQIKQKKISVRFFLNKNLQSDLIIGPNGKKQNGFPLYLYITYKRMNMKFKSKYGAFYNQLEDVELRDPGLLAFEEKLITKIIRFEDSFLHVTREYELKGIKERYDFFSVSLFSAIEKYLKPKLRIEILKMKSDFRQGLNLNRDTPHNTVLILYKMAEVLFENFQNEIDKNVKQEIETYYEFFSLIRSQGKYNFPTIVDWMDGSFVDELHKLVKKKNGNDTKLISRIDNIINEAIQKIRKESAK